jgi:hypothetical protein
MEFMPVRVWSVAPSLAEESVDTMVVWCKRLNMPLTEDQMIAGRYLEARGARFLIEFGYGNAVAKADELFQLECEKALELGLIH